MSLGSKQNSSDPQPICRHPSTWSDSSLNAKGIQSWTLTARCCGTARSPLPTVSWYVAVPGEACVSARRHLISQPRLRGQAPGSQAPDTARSLRARFQRQAGLRTGSAAARHPLINIPAYVTTHPPAHRELELVEVGVTLRVEGKGFHARQSRREGRPATDVWSRHWQSTWEPSQDVGFGGEECFASRFARPWRSQQRPFAA